MSQDPNHPPTILVADDEPDLRSCLLELLTSEGYEVVTASDGLDGWRKLEQMPACSLILLDFMMPVMDARAFRRRQLASAQLRRIPTLVVTAAAEVPEADLAADAIVRKPVDIDELLALISSLITEPC